MLVTLLPITAFGADSTIDINAPSDTGSDESLVKQNLTIHTDLTSLFAQGMGTMKNPNGISTPEEFGSAGETILDIALGSITIRETGANGGGVSETTLNPAGYIITMSSGTSTTNTISVTASTKVTLSGICINVSETENACAFSIENDATVNLIVTDTNTIESGKNKAGLQVRLGTAVVISGTGSLMVTGGTGAAGIGGSFDCNCGNITISGGTVTAMGGGHGAGIGGGDGYVSLGSNGNSGIITINGNAEVTALSEGSGAGIGGGYYGDNQIVTIAGNSKVTASSGEYGNGAGIGGGFRGLGGTITIEGNAEVVASSGNKMFGYSYSGGAGIGGGGYCSGGIITITENSKVLATGGRGGAGIGGGYRGLGGAITIEGDASVTAKCKVSSDYILLGGAGIGGGREGDSGTIIVAGSAEVTAIGDDYAAGIGGGYQGAGDTITISENAEVEATSRFTGAGIGGGYQADCGTITIEDNAVITATGGEYGAGIGCSSGGVGGTVNISGGIVNATGGDGGAGIGSGFEGACDIININDGIVNATGGSFSAGVGGGQSSAAGIVNIAGGTVNATASNGAAGIGGGSMGSGGTISITGGTVYAQKQGDNAPCDIGHGQNSTGGTLSITGDSAVLLRNNLCITPTTTTHALYSTDIQTNAKVFGEIDVVTGWEDITIYAYLNTSEVSTLTFDTNGGTGTMPEQRIQYNGTTAVLPDGSGLIKNRLHFLNWNTQADGLGIDYSDGATYMFAADVVLYAKYEEPSHVTSVSLSSHQETLGLGETQTLTATVLPEDATYPEVTWSCDNTDIATVDQSGLVTAVGVGSTNIIATADGISDNCNITVEIKPVTGVSLNNIPEALYIGNSFTLTANVMPSDATYNSVSWSSSNTGVATVSDGTVTAVGPGTATITVTTQDGGFTDTCTVTVKILQIESTVYRIDRLNSCICGMDLGTSVSSLIANLSNDSADIKVYDIGGNEYTGAPVCTGMKVKLIVNSTVYDKLSIVMLGDASGDGAISISDYTLTRLDILGLKALEGAYRQASDVNGDGQVSIADYTLIRLDILGLKSIIQ